VLPLLELFIVPRFEQFEFQPFLPPLVLHSISISTISSCKSDTGMPLSFSHPPTLEDDMTSSTMDDLPKIGPRFFVPRLTEKPQDPIMDTLKLANSKETHMNTRPIPLELAILTVDMDHPPSHPKNKNNIWTDAVTRNHASQVRILVIP
jgi:hypothetical protein